MPFILQTRVPGKDWTQLELLIDWWNTTLRFGFQQEHWESMESWASSHLLGDTGWGCWQPGTWHHLAGSWDREAVRLYVDGRWWAFALKARMEKHGIIPPGAGDCRKAM